MFVREKTFPTRALLLGVTAGLAAVAGSAAPGGDPCSPPGLDDTVTLPRTIEGIDWTIRYSNDEFLDDGENGDYVPTTIAEAVADELEYSTGRHASDWGFGPPYFTALPDVFVNIYDSQDTGTYSGKSCVTLDAAKMRTATEWGIHWVVNHELFHARQSGYTSAAGGDFSGFGSWTIEATARCLDDRYDDALDGDAGPFLVDASRLMNSDHEDLGPYRDLSLFDLGYRACLFWSYCCEQLGTIKTEPDSGVDFIRTFWEAVGVEMEEDEVRDAVATLDGVIRDAGGGSFEQMWHDYTICMLTRELDASALPNASRYLFLDEQPAGNAGGAPYADVVRTAVHDGNDPFPQAGSSGVEAFGQRFFELTNLSISQGCQVVGVNAVANREVGWALVGIVAGATSADPDRAVILSKQRGTEFVQSFPLHPTETIERLALVVTGFEEAADIDYTFDRGGFTHSIVRPTAAHPEHPGPHDAAERVLVRVQVEGPDGLKPAGVGPRSIKGLRAEDFVATIGGANAPVLSATYLGDEYWLLVDAPEQGADGAYDLSVIMCSAPGMGVEDISTDAVVYDDLTRNHMLVVDSSGSMSFPDDGSGSKLDAAKKAMELYIDAVGSKDRLGVVGFSGEGSECNEDATTELSIAQATSGQRDDARQAVDTLDADGWTSIGDGVWNAQDEFDGLPAGETNLNTITLLSDGQENEARFWASSINCGGGDQGDAARDRIIPAGTAVNAIALGPEANEALMETIGDETAGDFTYVGVADTAGPAAMGASSTLYNDLGDAYMRLLERARGLERVAFFRGTALGGASTLFPLAVAEAELEEATFFFHWPKTAASVSVRLLDPDGVEVVPPAAQRFDTDTHVVYHLIGTPPPGDWQVEVTPTADIALIGGLSARNGKGVQMLTVVTQIPTGGPLELENTYGPFEWGVPVLVTAILASTEGPVLGADVSATVTRPDGTLACPILRLRDDGTGGDERPGDGVYAARYSDTSQAGLLQGVVNDDPSNPHPGGESGTYLVEIDAHDGPGSPAPFQRYATEAFHVFRTNTSLDDGDGDGLPDTWEVHYGTNPTLDDSQKDPDGDRLVNLKEFENGCDPFDQDTDDGGENDRSEVVFGRCPIDAQDDSLPCLLDVGVVTHPEHEEETMLRPLALRLRFPVHPAYERIDVYRSTSPIPASFVRVAQLSEAEFEDGIHYDENLLDGQTYHYRFQSIGSGGATSCMSRMVQGTARLNPIPPQGWFFVNSGAERTDSLDVLLTLNMSTGAQWYRVSNEPIVGGGPAWKILPASPYVHWTLAAAPSERAWVHVQYLDSVSGVISQEMVETILYDPFGDFDGDSIANDADADDDGDGLLDEDEVFIHHTRAFEVDTDADGRTDGFEATHPCSHPRNPDTDGDGLLDGDDPWCARQQ